MIKAKAIWADTMLMKDSLSKILIIRTTMALPPLPPPQHLILRIMLNTKVRLKLEAEHSISCKFSCFVNPPELRVKVGGMLRTSCPSAGSHQLKLYISKSPMLLPKDSLSLLLEILRAC